MTSSTSKTWRLPLLAAAAFAITACASVGPIEENVPFELTYDMQIDQVGEDTIAYYTDGEGTPSVYLLHGIPTTSALWRNVAPIVAEAGTVVAFDLPGYGQSSVPASGDYSHDGLYAPMAAWLDQQEAPFVMVVTDLGSMLGIDYAMRNPDRVNGLVLVEAAFMPAEPWRDQLTTTQKAMFPMMRSNWFANFMITSQPRFQGLALNMGTVRKYSKAEKERYLGQYDDVERRKVVRDGPGPTAMPKNAISVAPDDMAAKMNQNAAALAETEIPILLLTADPGMIVQPEAIEYARNTFKNLTVTEIGAGRHFVQEDQPTAIGVAIRDWLIETGFSDKEPPAEADASDPAMPAG
ncbi:MAG: alpha/beta fold hydrolase [Henriciella sp.]|nr:alpha/beta fold hydrolase [Henriciella sp.]